MPTKEPIVPLYYGAGHLGMPTHAAEFQLRLAEFANSLSLLRLAYWFPSEQPSLSVGNPIGKHKIRHQVFRQNEPSLLASY